ncbi:hypothetical protein MLD38_036837 [Melastoma candidum]|uniref:Uncharacterized protein n=1 Tax=Melastoma candidum TaxID=119954 RepID=A0ACB9LLB4_9MYRT|nr:hypothetical protein MLD38_036837 [Melastoma candidum]
MAAAALQSSSSSVLSSAASAATSRTRSGCINVAQCSIRIPRRTQDSSVARKLVQELTSLNNISAYPRAEEPLMIELAGDVMPIVQERSSALDEIYLLLRAVSDRYEMHRNVGEQRDNWNSLLLNSVNMMTLTATATAAFAGALSPGGAGLAAKVSSAVLFSAAAGIMMVVNKIQPSQLAEEQRNASRLFKQLESEITTLIATKSSVTERDVREFTGKILALDRAYPLPLLGAMIEKFPAKFSPAKWTSPDQYSPSPKTSPCEYDTNGWSPELEAEMCAILHVIKQKDKKDYMRLGNIALKLNKALAVTGPFLTAAAAAASAFGVPTAAAAAGALAAAVNTLEHGGQVGMVVEMYRNCAGFFDTLENTIEGSLKEEDPRRRENGEVFERKVAMSLGRSLSEMRELAWKATTTEESEEVDEFASKLF